jgi:Tfp pilus assembly protein PilF
MPGQFLRLRADDQRIAMWHNEENLEVWELAPGGEHRTLHYGLRGNQSDRAGYDLGGFEFSKDGRLLIGSGRSAGTWVWDLADPLCEAARLPDYFDSLSFSPKGDHLLTLRGDHGLYVWPVTSNRGDEGREVRFGPPRRVSQPAGNTGAGWTNTGEGIIELDSKRGQFLVHNLNKPGKARVFGPHPNISGFRISPDGRYVATSAWHPLENSIRVWDLSGTGLVKELAPRTGFSAFTPDGQWLVTVPWTPHPGQLWRIGSWEPGPETPHLIGATEFTPDGEYVTSVRDNPLRINVFKASSGEPLATLLEPYASVSWFQRWSPGRNMLAIRGDHYRVRLWNVAAIRRQLAEMGLDWDEPPLPEPKWNNRPLKIEVDSGNMAKHAEARKLVAKAVRLEKAKEYGEALTTYRMAIERDPEQAAGHNHLAWMLLVGPKELRDPARALPLARKAVELAPEDFNYHNTLGVALYYNGFFSDAVPVLEASLRDSRGRSDAYDLFFLAMCHHHLGDAAKASECYDRAVRWVGDRRGKLSAGSIEELTAFQAEARALLGAPNVSRKE